MNSPAPSNRPTPQRAPVPNSPDWLLRLWKNENVPVSEDELCWWSAHVQSFLTTVRRSQEQGSLLPLVDRFLEDQAHASPPLPDWRLRQMRHGLPTGVQRHGAHE